MRTFVLCALLLGSTACVEVRAPSPPAGQRSASVDAILDDVIKPSWGRNLGLRDTFDGKIGDYSEAGIRARITKLERAKAALDGIDPATLDEATALDRDLLRLAVEEELFQLRDLEVWRR